MPDEREARVLGRLLSRSHAAISRLNFEVAGQQLTLFAGDGGLHSLCTCGVARCEHYGTALRWLEPDMLPAELLGTNLRSSLPPATPSGGAFAGLADAFDALLLAVVRSGVSATSPPSVRDAIDRLTALAPVPLPLGLARWLSRLHEALQRSDVGKTARVLEGARVFADDLRLTSLTPEQSARRLAWLSGASATRRVEPLESATLLEVAREWLPAVGRGSIERRYLLDLQRGEVVREDRGRAEADASVGPCPRVLEVAFGEVEPFGAPRRVQLLQYTVSARPSAQHWARSEPFAKRLVQQVTDGYAAAVRPCPGMAEPFVLVAPHKVEVAQRPAWFDGEGQRMLLGEEGAQPLAELLNQAGQLGRIVWIAGRLVGLAQGLVLKPVSLLLQRADGPHLLRVS